MSSDFVSCISKLPSSSFLLTYISSSFLLFFAGIIRFLLLNDISPLFFLLLCYTVDFWLLHWRILLSIPRLHLPQHVFLFHSVFSFAVGILLRLFFWTAVSLLSFLVTFLAFVSPASFSLFSISLNIKSLSKCHISFRSRTEELIILHVL